LAKPERVGSVLSPRYHPLIYGVTRVTLREGAAGVSSVQADQALKPYAHASPNAYAMGRGSWMARRTRNPDGGHPEGNDPEHALLALGCIYAGMPYFPASSAYSIVSTDFEISRLGALQERSQILGHPPARRDAAGPSRGSPLVASSDRASFAAASLNLSLRALNSFW
jgi:hypothetical protein